MPSKSQDKNLYSVKTDPQSDALSKAKVMFDDGVSSVNALFGLYEITTKGSRGRPHHAQQDLLRATLVLAGATLDATVKRVIQDSLFEVVSRSESAKEEAAKFIHRQMLAALDKKGGEYLSMALLADSPRQGIVSYLIDEVTGDSFQSFDRLSKAAKLLGFTLSPNEDVRAALEARNQIIHEMDVSPTAPRQGQHNRRPRQKAKIKKWCCALLSIADDFLEKTDNCIKS